jgi:hypothetical protein
MPLDSQNKINHIQAVVLRTFKGRQKTVVFVYESAGIYTYTAVSVIFRPQEVIDPQVPNLSGHSPGIPWDMYLIAPVGTNFAGVVFIADTTTATQAAVASAQKYEPIEIVPTGIVPGGTHVRVNLRRLR